jgi:hypothetical protein
MATVMDFAEGFYKHVDKSIHHFLWRSTEWITRNVLFNARCHGGLGLTHVQSKVKAMRLIQIIQFLKDPDKEAALLARRWIGIKIIN